MMIRIRVAFRYGDPRLFSRFVAWWSRTDVSHCELALVDNDDGTVICGSASLLDGGVRLKPIELDPLKWRVYEIPCENQRATATWFIEHRGEPYDWLGLLGFVFRRIKGLRKAWFCSEACAAALGWPEPWRYSVADFERAVSLIAAMKVEAR